MLSEEVTSATASTEYLSQKRAWGEDRLGVARLLSLFSPAGHSLVSWAAACGQTEVVEILMNHGATAELGDETQAVSASIIQVRRAEQKATRFVHGGTSESHSFCTRLSSKWSRAERESARTGLGVRWEWANGWEQHPFLIQFTPRLTTTTRRSFQGGFVRTRQSNEKAQNSQKLAQSNTVFCSLFHKKPVGIAVLQMERISPQYLCRPPPPGPAPYPRHRLLVMTGVLPIPAISSASIT